METQHYLLKGKNFKGKNKKGNARKKIDKLKLTNTIARMDNVNVQNYAVTEAQGYTIQLLRSTVDRKSNSFAEQDSEFNRLRVFKESLQLELEIRTIDLATANTKLEIIRLFYRIGRSLSDARFVRLCERK